MNIQINKLQEWRKFFQSSITNMKTLTQKDINNIYNQYMKVRLRKSKIKRLLKFI